MDVKDIRLERLRVLLADHGHRKKDLAAKLKRSQSQVSQWLHGHRTITEESARQIETNAGKPHRWLDTRSGDPEPLHVAREMSVQPYTLPATISWEAIVQAVDLPDYFVLAMPDDALAPNVPKGLGLVFSTSATPIPGDGVLVEDRDGRRFVRRYAEGPGGQWLAQAINPAYVTLESGRDNLRRLAVMTGRLGGSV